MQDAVVQSSIHAAAQADNADAIAIILKAHPELANCNNGDEFGPTPLEVAAESGSFQAVKTLLAMNGKEWRTASPFKLALKGGYTRTAKELVSYNCDVFPLLEKHSAALFEMLLWCVVDSHITSFETLAKTYLTPLKRRLAEPSQEKHRLWSEKESVLKKCFDHACRFSTLQMVKLVFDATETLDVNNDKLGGPLGVPALIFAARTGNFELVEFCLRVGADSFSHKDGKTALDISRQRGHAKIVVLLEQTMRGNYGGRIKSMFRNFNH
jgi:ankyrin repeat protein